MDDTGTQSVGFEEKIKTMDLVIAEKQTDDEMMAVFCPKGVNILIKGRDYVLEPPPLKKIAILNKFWKQMQQMSSAENMEEVDFDKVLMSIAEAISILLGKPEDKDFLHENLTQPMLQFIFEHTTQLVQPRKNGVART